MDYDEFYDKFKGELAIAWKDPDSFEKVFGYTTSPRVKFFDNFAKDVFRKQKLKHIIPTGDNYMKDLAEHYAFFMKFCYLVGEENGTKQMAATFSKLQAATTKGLEILMRQ